LLVQRACPHPLPPRRSSYLLFSSSPSSTRHPSPQNSPEIVDAIVNRPPLSSHSSLMGHRTRHPTVRQDSTGALARPFGLTVLTSTHCSGSCGGIGIAIELRPYTSRQIPNSSA